MEIGNRMHDVIKLRSNIMQELLSLVIKPNWKEEFNSKVEFYVENNQNSQIYSAPYDKIRVKGLENYDIKDMDVTLIRAIFIHNKDLLSYKISKKLENAIEDIKEDRNLTNHSSENETDNELYLRALVSLCDIRKLVRIADDRKTGLPNSKELQEFRTKNEELIEELMNTIDYERFDLVSKYIKFEKDTDRILKEKDEDQRYEIYRSIVDSYMSLNKTNHDYLYILLEFEAYIYERGINLGKDGALMYYAHVGDLEKYNAEYAKIFQAMNKKDRAKNLKSIREYFGKLNMFFKGKKADSESINRNLDLIENLGFKICRTENGTRLELDSENNN